MKDLMLVEGIERRIYLIRGQRVMLDSDLAAIYGVSTKRLNEQVKRNQRRFPADFIFRLTAQEAVFLRSQNATLKIGQGRHRKYLPFVFTEYGAVMLASVLNTLTAVDASVRIARAFVKLREMIVSHKELTAKLAELERKVEGHDEHIHSLFDAIHQLMEPPKKPKRIKGFAPND